MKKVITIIVVGLLFVINNTNAQTLQISILGTTPKIDTVVFTISEYALGYPGMVVLYQMDKGGNLIDKDTVYTLGSVVADTFDMYHYVPSTDTFVYHACIWNTNGSTGCSDPVSVATLNTTGIVAEVASPFVVTVTPNPTDYKARLTFPPKVNGEICTVMNMAGQVVRRFVVDESIVFYKEDLPTGIYFLVVRGVATKFVLK